MYNSRGQESTPIAHGKLPTFFLNFSKKKNSKPFQSASARTLPKHRFGEQTLVEEVTTGPRGKISTRVVGLVPRCRRRPQLAATTTKWRTANDILVLHQVPSYKAKPPRSDGPRAV